MSDLLFLSAIISSLAALTASILFYAFTGSRWSALLWIATWFLPAGIIMMNPLPIYIASVFGLICLHSVSKSISRGAPAEKVRRIVDETIGEKNLVSSCVELTNRFASRASKVLGSNFVIKLLRECVRISGTGDVTESGEFYVPPQASESDVLRTLFLINTKLVDAYATLTTKSHARDVFSDVFGERGSCGEILIGYGLPAILFKNIFEPMLRECSEDARRKVGSIVREISEDLEVSNGEIRLDKFYSRLSQIQPHERVERTIKLFSSIMNSCYPVMRSDIGERANRLISRKISAFLSHYRVALGENILGALPIDASLYSLTLIPGHSYVVKERKPAMSFKIFSEIVRAGADGLCITRQLEVKAPAEIIWLGKKSPNGSYATEKMAEIIKKVEDFVSRRRNTVILLDGLEYLSVHYDFSTVLRFLHELREIIAMHNSRLIIPLNEKAFGERELALIERDLEILPIS